MPVRSTTDRDRRLGKDSEPAAPPIVIDVVSRESGKVAMAEVASALARNHDRSSKHANPAEDFSLSIRELKSLMESTLMHWAFYALSADHLRSKVKPASRHRISCLYTIPLPINNRKLCSSCLASPLGISASRNTSKHEDRCVVYCRS